MPKCQNQFTLNWKNLPFRLRSSSAPPEESISDSESNSDGGRSDSWKYAIQPFKTMSCLGCVGSISRNLDLCILDIKFSTFLCPRGFEGGGRGDGEGDDEEEDEAPQELLLVCR